MASVSRARSPQRPNNVRSSNNRRHGRRQRHRNPSRTSVPSVPGELPTVFTATTPASPFNRLLHTALQAPRRLVNAMTGNGSFPVIWDYVASHCVTFEESDFISEIKDPGALRRVQGINSGLNVTGIGMVQWTIHDESGGLRHLQLPALLVPQCTARLLSTPVLLRTYPNEHLIQHASFMRLTCNKIINGRPSVLVPLDSRSGLLKASMYRKEAMEVAVPCLGETISSVRSDNLNLSASEKELLKWHYRLGHLSFVEFNRSFARVSSHILKAPAPFIALLVAFAIRLDVLLAFMESKVLALSQDVLRQL